jgi:glycosyltransferase involved in cell wall biosynthesis
VTAKEKTERPHGGASLRARCRIHYTGMLRSPASWSKVARELLLALIEEGYLVGASELFEDRCQPDFPLPPALLDALRPAEEGDIQLTFSDPVDYPRILKRPPRVGMLVYEATLWPPHWVALAQEHLEHVVVPSNFCRETLADSGYPLSRISVVPHGIDPTLYHARGRSTPGSGSALRLLFVGTPARRKGLDILLSAIETAFSPADSVSLVIKTLPYSDAEARPYVDRSWRERVESLRRRGYRIDVLTDVLSETELAELYRRVDLICLPSRGEGFALPLLEAMACGTPALTTGWSGPTDFVDDANGFPVREYSLIPGGQMLIDFNHPSRSQAQMVEPSASAVSDCLRRAFEDRAGLARKGEAAGELAARWTWKAAALQLVEGMERAGIV